MEQVLSRIIGNLDYFVLAFIRVTALVVSSPIFGRRNIPNAVKIGLCLCLTYIVFIALPATPAIPIGSIIEYAFLCIKELLFGLVLGYVTTLFFSLVQTAGYIIDMQMGFGMVNVFDVQSNISVPMTGNFFYIILTICFFAVNAHHQLIYVLVGTFDTIAIGQVRIDAQLGIVALEVFIMAFVMALNVAMPFIASGLLGELVLGFLVRTTPQLNVFVVGMPLKIVLGFLMILLVIPGFVAYSNNIFQQMYDALDTMLKGLAGIT